MKVFENMKYVSNQRWHDILPPQAAINQIARDRQNFAVRARKAGITFAAIGEKLGVGPSRANQIYLAGVRAKNHNIPFDAYIAGLVDDIRELASAPAESAFQIKRRSSAGMLEGLILG